VDPFTRELLCEADLRNKYCSTRTDAGQLDWLIEFRGLGIDCGRYPKRERDSEPLVSSPISTWAFPGPLGSKILTLISRFH
jgi:hypothetical protein